MTTAERLTAIETNLSYVKKDVSEIKENMVNNGEFKLIKGLVLGFCGLILMTVCGLMVTSAINTNSNSNSGIGSTDVFIATPTPPLPQPYDPDDKKSLGFTPYTTPTTSF